MSSNARKLSRASIALIIVSQFGALFFIGIILSVMAGSLAGFARWYTNGGYPMHLIAMLMLAQPVAGTVIGIMSLRMRVPLFVHLLPPALVAVAGLGGTLLGMHVAFEAIATAPPDMIGQMLAASIAIASIPRDFACVVAGAGCAGLVVTGLAIRGAWPNKDDADHRAAAFSGSVLAGLGAILFVAAIGAAFAYGYLAQANEVIASAPPDTRFAMLSMTLHSYHNTVSATFVGVIVALVASAGLVATARRGAADWAGSRAYEGIVAAAIVAGVVGLNVWYNGEVRERSKALAETTVAKLPEGINLPVSDSQLLITDAPIVSLVGDKLWVQGKEVPLQASSFAPLAPQAPPREEEGVAASRKKKNVTNVFGKMFGPAGGRGGIWGIGVTPASSCPPSSLPILAVAIDRDTPFATINRFVKELRKAGGCKVKLIVTAKGEEVPPEVAAERRKLFEPIEAVLAITDRSRSAINVTLAPSPDTLPRDDNDKPPLHLSTSLQAGKIILAGSGGVLGGSDSANPGFSLEQARRELIEIKDTFPDERELWVKADEVSTFSDFVAMLDAAREVEDPGGESRNLFDDVHWVVPLDGEKPGGLDDLREKGKRSDQLGAIAARTLESAGSSQPAAAIRTESPSVGGSLPAASITRVVRSRMRSIKDCYEKELHKDPTLAGKIVVDFTIGASGRVEEASVKSDDMRSPAVGQCAVSRIRRWRFPKPDGGGSVEVSYPFTFAPK